jgi:hypothetical protein
VSSARRNRLYGDPDSTANVCSHAEEADGRRTLALHATDGREARTLPRLIAPMLLRPGLPARERAADWAFELKWDGMRAQLRIAPDGRWCLRSRPGRDCSDHFPELAALADALRGGAVLLDGELVCLNSDGRPDFQRLRRRLSATDHAAAAHLADAHPSTLVVVDVLHLDGRAVRDLPTRSAASSSAHELPAAGPSRPNPLMTRAQCSAWLAQRGYPEPSKSACIGCPIPHHVVLAFLWRRAPCHPIDCPDARRTAAPTPPFACVSIRTTPDPGMGPYSQCARLAHGIALTAVADAPGGARRRPVAPDGDTCRHARPYAGDRSHPPGDRCDRRINPRARPDRPSPEGADAMRQVHVRSVRGGMGWGPVGRR